MFKRKSIEYKTRKSPARPDNVEFIEPNFYRQTLKNDLKTKIIKYSLLLVILGLGIRMTFMDGGILELKEKKNLVTSKSKLLKKISLENSELKSEILKIRKDNKYQRKLARDHLGVIAEDEFVILFEEDLEHPSKRTDPQL